MFGYRVLDRFRDLEGAGQTGRKDAALLAAIAGFEALAFPTSRDQRQFSNLFLGLFPYVKDETRRMAAAALSRLIALPESIACHIADQPIRVAAPFLAFSSCVNDRMLLQAIARHGVSHARAISRRKTLSPTLISALAELDDPAVQRSLRVRGTIEAEAGDRAPTDGPDHLRKEEDLRNRLKDMALAHPHRERRRDMATSNGVLGELLAKQARGRNPVRFAECLALALRTNRALADRILLDPSGGQLAIALRTLEIKELHALSILEGVFPHLAQTLQGERHSRVLLQSCELEESVRRVDAWRRANEEDRKPELQPLTVDASTRAARIPASRRQRVNERRDRFVRRQA